MKNPVGICTWSLKNDISGVLETLEAAGLKHLHLDVSAADAFKQAVDEHGLTVTSTMIAFPQEDYSTMDRIKATGGIMPDDCWEQNRALAIAAIRKTAELGVPFLSTHAGFIDHADKEGYQKFMVRLKELADCAKENGIHLILETGQETAVDLRSCLQELNHPAVGVNFDPANMILYGKGDPIEALEVLAPWIRHVHVKDATVTEVPGEWGAEVAWGDGDVDTAAFVAMLEETGYTGALAIEREAGDSRMEDIALAAKRLGV
jgi:sugar phosphate isomerase/epimerase